MHGSVSKLLRGRKIIVAEAYRKALVEFIVQDEFI
tara:strand:+ start:106 stop:210 length:105 start_codon:yes stop_codon:yes gene_type:complete